MLRNDGTGNFNPVHDGMGNANLNGYKRSEQIINAANDALANNQKMWLPNPNTTPTPQIRIRYLLTGVYFHNDTRLMGAYTDGSGNVPGITELNNTYGVNPDSEINYYFTRSLNWNGQELGGNGVGDIDIHAGISSSYLAYLIAPNYLPMHTSLLNHEIGHILSLSHTWAFNDGCDDTPTHGYVDANGNTQQCFFWNQPPVTCDWHNVSNNVMDYNNWQNSYTTCQVGKMHDHLNSTAGNPYIHSCDGCTPVNAFFALSGCFNIPPPNSPSFGGEGLFLNGESSVNEDKYKITICEVASIGSPVCTGGYFNTGLVNGAIDKINLKNIYNFQGNKIYKIELEVGSSNCFTSSVHTKYVQINVGYCPGTYSSED
jgi:Pregnancy-associated plasma protein-A